MNSKQREWILNKLNIFINKYNQYEKLTEEQFEQMTEDAEELISSSKGNKLVKDLVFSVMACFDSAEQVRG